MAVRRKKKIVISQVYSEAKIASVLAGCKAYLARMAAYPLLPGFGVVVQQANLHETVERGFHTCFHLCDVTMKLDFLHIL